jgi:hypothetical protein
LVLWQRRLATSSGKPPPGGGGGRCAGEGAGRRVRARALALRSALCALRAAWALALACCFDLVGLQATGGGAVPSGEPGLRGRAAGRWPRPPRVADQRIMQRPS